MAFSAVFRKSGAVCGHQSKPGENGHKNVGHQHTRAVYTNVRTVLEEWGPTKISTCVTTKSTTF